METWKCKRRRKNTRFWLLEEEEKMCASGYWKEVQLCASGYCAVTQFAKKATPSCFVIPLRCKCSKQWGRA